MGVAGSTFLPSQNENLPQNENPRALSYQELIECQRADSGCLGQDFEDVYEYLTC